MADSKGIIKLQADTHPGDDITQGASGRVVLKSVLLTPETVVGKKIEEGMELIEVSFGSAKLLSESNWEGDEHWEKVMIGLKHIAIESRMFLAKNKFGEFGACEVTVKTVKWLIHDDVHTFNLQQIEALIWGCKALAVLADTEITNKIRLGRCGAITIANDVISSFTKHRSHELQVNALQILLNLPKSIMPSQWNNAKHPLAQEFGAEDTVGRMLDEGTDMIVLDLFGDSIREMQELNIPHTPIVLEGHQEYATKGPNLHRILDMSARLLQSFANNGEEIRHSILSKGLGGHLIRSMHLNMPILPVPSGDDVPHPIDEEPDPHQEDDYEEPPEVTEARNQARQDAYHASVAHKEKLGELTRNANKKRYTSLQTILRTIVVFSLDDISRSAICDGHNDHTNAIKVLMKVMTTAFHDHDTRDYRNAKIREIQDFKQFQSEQGWTDVECEIYKAVQRNPHMHAHKKKSRPGLLETMRQHTEKSNPNKKQKGKIDRGPPASPTRTTVINLHATPRVGTMGPMSRSGMLTMSGGSTFNPGQSLMSLNKSTVIQEKIKAPLSIIVAEHACWALSVLTVVTCVGHRMELLECGAEHLRDMAHTVHGIPSEEEEEADMETARSSASKSDSKQESKTSRSSSPKNLKLTNTAGGSIPEMDDDGTLATITENVSITEAARASVVVPPIAIPQEPSIIAYATLDLLNDHEVPFYKRLHRLILHANAVHTKSEDLHLEVEGTHHLPKEICEMDTAPPNSMVFIT
jgi:hypothetical protein